MLQSLNDLCGPVLDSLHKVCIFSCTGELKMGHSAPDVSKNEIFLEWYSVM